MRRPLPLVLLAASLPLAVAAGNRRQQAQEARQAARQVQERMLSALDDEARARVQRGNPRTFDQFAASLQDEREKRAVVRELLRHRVSMEESEANMSAVGKALLSLGETGEASQLGQQMQEKYPDNPTGYFLQAKALAVLLEDAPAGESQRQTAQRAREAAEKARDLARSQGNWRLMGHADTTLNLIRATPAGAAAAAEPVRAATSSAQSRMDEHTAKVQGSMQLAARDSETAREVLRSLIGGPHSENLLQDLREAEIAVWPVPAGSLNGKMAEVYNVGGNDYVLKIDQQVIEENGEATLAPLAIERLDNAAYQREFGDGMWSSVLMYLRGKVRKVFVSYELQDAGHRFNEDTELARENNWDVRSMDNPTNPVGGREADYYGSERVGRSTVMSMNAAREGPIGALYTEAQFEGRDADRDRGVSRDPGYGVLIRETKAELASEIEEFKSGHTRSRPRPPIDD